MNIIDRARHLASLESIMPSASQWSEAKKLLRDLARALEDKERAVKESQTPATTNSEEQL